MSLNPLDSTLREIRDMNDILTKHLEKIIHRLDKLIEQNDHMMEWDTRNREHNNPS
jgi:hypothetical protein